jgi:excisionase family DNA binding protein
MSSNIRIQRICIECGEEFTARTTVTKFCSLKCGKRFTKAKARAAKIEASDQETKAIKEKPIAALKEKPYLSIDEASQLLGISRRTLYRMIERGEFPSAKAGRRTIIRRSDIDGLFEMPVKQPEKAEPVPASIPDCYNLTEIQIKFGASESMIQNLIKKHRIPKLKHGKFAYVPKRIIDALLS